MEVFFNLTWLIPLPPLIAFFAIILFLNPRKRLSSTFAIVMVVLSGIMAWLVAFAYFADWHPLIEEPYHVSIPWIPTGVTTYHIGVYVDAVTAVMLFMVGFILTMIFIYSSGYMSFPGHLPRVLDKDGLDPRYSRFFAYISLFATGMLGLVVADNLLLLFIFWEIMGLCSYLLIGFWFDKKYPDPKQITPKQAGLKAFLTTRVGDVLLMMGMIFLFILAGSVDFEFIFQPAVMERIAAAQVTLPLFGSVSWAVVIAILIFWGAIGKSAQFPLHVWLPDAMEGPTPVSALIHAATMVSAGVYLIIRMFPVFIAANEGVNGAMLFVGFIGAFTALFAATIAVAQNDIKKVLAYSTISQLGFMFAALGMGAWVAATFHLITHAFFKGLLFLGSGSVIHGVEHGHHNAHDAHAHAAPSHDASGHDEHGHDTHEEHAGEYFDAQNMLNMGGLLKRMPRTGWTFIIGALSLSGFPIITAGFWSKDEIFSEAYHREQYLVLIVLGLAALLTAFYTFRQVFLTFAGKPRTEAAALAPESVHSMTVPLILLSIFAIGLGWVGIPGWFPFVGEALGHPLTLMLEEQAHAYHIEAPPPPFNPIPIIVSVSVVLVGIIGAWLIYGRKPLEAGQRDPLVGWLGPIHPVLRNKYYFDELYQATVVRFFKWLAGFSSLFDRTVIDGIVNAVGRFGRWLATTLRKFFDELFIDNAVNGTGFVAMMAGSVLRLIQTGQVQLYLLVLLLAVLILLAMSQLVY